ncbi:MAG TPA: hypothetical protein VF432_04170 [Thermoanaerobaculia bacterium]
MKRLTAFLALTVLALPGLSQPRARTQSFASDFQTLPVVANVTGIGNAKFESYVALLNPTSSAFPVEVTLYDANGGTHEATISLGAHELKTYTNFLQAVFNYAGGGAATFRSPDPANRFILSSEVRTGAYTTAVPSLEFPGSTSPAFSPGVIVDSNWRTNVGCFNQSGAANAVAVKVLDSNGVMVGSATMNLAARAWRQMPIPSVVSNGVVEFEPSEAAVCYAVVVSNTTNDGRFVSATEYLP